ncbi:hypothetical protein [Laceyella sacchari]|jgi:hypothetical protein|uniref:Uncharacterized protein n=1 Tax=Laceyella sacchari TaxID=37482 RepID=A0ABY5U6U4_LACSH|nr:hypothetical protein [Laceyella sacchari]KPC75516.1 hypothetical protein ADL26_07460 [Thermoactinomyces vulgaris]UWE04879.1 hypothetical protein NYR52_07095 [Laceyella sacchari]
MRVERITGLMDNGRAKLWVRVDGKLKILNRITVQEINPLLIRKQAAPDGPFHLHSLPQTWG